MDVHAVSRNGRSSLLRLAVVGIALVALAAWASGVAGSASQARNAPPEWAWSQGVTPGERIAIDRDVRAALELSADEGVFHDSVRRVISARLGASAYSLLAARNPAGRVCFAAIAGPVAGGFACLNPLAQERALITFTASGGAELGRTDWSVLLGIARRDVARVAAVTVDGVERDLALNRWRAFRLESQAADSPAALRAYRSDGSLIEEAVTAG
jgi:hypothetical protein